MEPQKPYHIATSIVRKLVEEGYIAYFAGGWVRDYLLGSDAHEIDIATSAPPEIIMDLFPKTLPIGISFGVVLIIEDKAQVEVSTFRKDRTYKDGRHPEEIVFSSPEEDAKRRDFTINGMFYDPLNHTLFDFIQGEHDLKKGIIRAIGDPDTRFLEDRLRMLRAVRFSARFGFPIEKKTEKAIMNHAKTLFPAVSMERIWQEFNKMSESPRFDKAIIDLHRLGLLQTIFPRLKRLNISEIEKCVASFSEFPKSCPTIIYLMHLFPHDDLTSLLALCHYLKTPLADAKLIEFCYKSFRLFEKKTKEVEAAEWAKFYAHPQNGLVLDIQKAHLAAPKRTSFEELHLKQKQKLQTHIERLVMHSPLVTATHLLAQGITPGKKMGILLKEAERITINQNIEKPEEVLRLLKESSLW